MTLRISLRDGEKMIVNGAVLRSVGRTDVLVENRAALLRGREVMTPEEANTPARRLYFATMMAYIEREALATHQDRVLVLLRELMEAFENEQALSACVRLARHLADSDFYPALGECRLLIQYEGEALARVAEAAA
jgi:flagellar protein FlbT